MLTWLIFQFSLFNFHFLCYLCINGIDKIGGTGYVNIWFNGMPLALLAVAAEKPKEMAVGKADGKLGC